MSQGEETLWSQYEDMGVLGWGAFSEVRMAHHRLTGVKVAIKVLKKEEKFHSMPEEVDILKTITHPNIVSLFQIVDTDKKIFLVMEFCQKDLQQQISKLGPMEEPVARRVFGQVVDAISYCHTRGIAHRDIKAENIRLDSRAKVTVVDFGLATRFRPGEMLTMYRGTYMYISPEVMQHEAHDGPKRDMWALGILLYFLVIGTLPFKYEAIWELRQMTLRGRCKEAAHLSDGLKDLIGQLLTVSPKLRPTARAVLRHPWLRQGEGRSVHLVSRLGKLDTNVLSIMRFMCFDLSDTLNSIRERRFDHLMGTYCLLKYNAWAGNGFEDPVKLPCPEPVPSPTDPAASPLPPKRNHYVHVLRKRSSNFQEWEYPEDSRQAEQQALGSDSVPNVHLSCLKGMPTAIPAPEGLRPASAPGILFPSSKPELLEEETAQTTEEERLASSWGICESMAELLEDTDFSWTITTAVPAASSRGTHVGQGSSAEVQQKTDTPAPGSSAEVQQKTDTPEGISEEEPTTCTQGLCRCWKAFRSRIHRSLRRLFRRRPSQDSHPFKNRVATVTSEDRCEHHEAPGQS